MKVELKQIIEQLTEALELNKGYKVSALIDYKDNIQGWTIVKFDEETGSITPIENHVKFNNIKEMIEFYN